MLNLTMIKCMAVLYGMGGCCCYYIQGGLIAVTATLSHQDMFTGLILSSPALYSDVGSIGVSGHGYLLIEL